MELFFRVEATNSELSRKAQRGDIEEFSCFLRSEEGSDFRELWTPRLAADYIKHLRTTINEKTGKLRYSSRSINRKIAHLKRFSKWINKVKPFPLDDPMNKIKNERVGSLLNIERALTRSEHKIMLNQADLLREIGGLSQDRNRYKVKERPRRKDSRPYRNRAIIYTLVYTGMRRAAITNIDIDQIDFKNKTIIAHNVGGTSRRENTENRGIGPAYRQN